MQGLEDIKRQNRLRVEQVADVLEKALDTYVEAYPAGDGYTDEANGIAGEARNALALYREWKELNPVT